MLAAAIGVDRLAEVDIRRIVAADDRTRAFLGHARVGPRFELGFLFPAIVLARAGARFEAPFRIRRRTAALDARGSVETISKVGRAIHGDTWMPPVCPRAVSAAAIHCTANSMQRIDLHHVTA